MRQRWVAVLGMVCGLVVTPARAADPAALPTQPTAWAIFGLEQVSIGGRSRIAGDVGVNEGDATLRQRARVRGAVVANTITLRRATVDALFCTLVVGGDAGCGTLPVPVVPAASITLVQAPDPAGKDDVVVPRRAHHAPLAAGRYGSVRVASASELVLQGGSYAVGSLELGARARLSCESACEVLVHDDVRIGAAARFGGSGAAAGDVRLAVEGTGRGPAVRIGGRARVAAVVYAPVGDVEVGGASRVDGALVGRRVTVGARARITAAGS